jgi:hypothetical protein
MLYLSANGIRSMQMWEWRNKGYQMEEPPRISGD